MIPVNLKGFFNRCKAWFYALIVEHNFTNIFRLNLHKISPKMFRSSQPTPWQLKRIVKRYGIKTVLNLRGEKPQSPVYALEAEACEDAGVRLVSTEIFSRDIPTPERLEALKKIYESCEYPVLMHCKAGADRTGLAATLYLYWMENQPLSAIDQLKFFPYGHILHSDAGIIDYYFELFESYRKEHPDAELIEWTASLPRKKLKTEFRQNREGVLSNLLNNVILRRE